MKGWEWTLKESFGHCTTICFITLSHSGSGKGKVMKILTFAHFTVLKAFFHKYDVLILQLFNDTDSGDVLLFLLGFHC